MAREHVDTTPKRNEIQIVNDRRRVAELLLQGYKHSEIRDILENETGISLSRRTITNDVAAIRKDWQEQQRASVSTLINQEMSRLDSDEAVAWQAWRSSCADVEQETIERVAKYLKRDDEYTDEYDLKVQKVTQIIKKSGGAGDPRFFNIILDIQKERRKLLGLYAPSKIGVNVTNKTEIIVKGYAVKDVSPDAWPALNDGVIEGELVDGG